MKIPFINEWVQNKQPQQQKVTWKKFMEMLSLIESDMDNVAIDLGYDTYKTMRSNVNPEILFEKKSRKKFLEAMHKNVYPKMDISLMEKALENIFHIIQTIDVFESKSLNPYNTQMKLYMTQFGEDIHDAFFNTDNFDDFQKVLNGQDINQNQWLDLFNLLRMDKPNWEHEFNPKKYVYDFLMALGLDPHTQSHQNF